MRPVALRLVGETPPTHPRESLRLAEHIPAGKLIELSGAAGCAVTTTAISIVRQAQREGETSAWIQLQHGRLFPPDLHDYGIDLDALVVVHVDGREKLVLRMARVAELLLRSGGFGLVVIDLRNDGSIPPRHDEAWHGRLLGLVRHHHARAVLLTEKSSRTESLGPLVGLRIESHRTRTSHGRFALVHETIKSKSGPLELAHDEHRGPWGLL